jgi:hypothetical protein
VYSTTCPTRSAGSRRTALAAAVDARFLNFLQLKRQIARWLYESRTFWFETIRRGVRSYKPDFEVTMPDGSTYFIEVKGWMGHRLRPSRMGMTLVRRGLLVDDRRKYVRWADDPALDRLRHRSSCARSGQHAGITARVDAGHGRVTLTTPHPRRSDR